MASHSSTSIGRAQGNVGFDLPGFTQIGGLALLGNLIGLFAWTWIALIVLAFCAATLCIETLQSTRPRVAPFGQDGAPLLSAGFVLLMAGVLWALVAGVLVGALGVVSFKLAAAIAISLFALRTAAYSAGRYLTAFGIIAALLFSAGTAYAVYACDAPPGSPEQNEKERKGCKIVVTVVDEEERPIEFATVDCQWRDEDAPAPPPGARPSQLRHGDFSIQTNERGIAERVMFLFDPEDKVAYLDISVSADAAFSIPAEPASEDDAQAATRERDAYRPERYELRDISPGETRELSVTLTRP